MANRVYLNGAKLAPPGGVGRNAAWTPSSRTPLAASYRLPLAWMCLFAPGDVTYRQVSDDDAWIEVATPAAAGLARLATRAPRLRAVAGDLGYLVDAFVKHAQTLGPWIVADVFELAMMSKLPQFCEGLMIALVQLDRPDAMTPGEGSHVFFSGLRADWRTADDPEGAIIGWKRGRPPKRPADEDHRLAWREAVATRPPVAYAPGGDFAVGTLLAHPTLGTGLVVVQREGGKLDVFFENGVRQLVHRR